MRIFPAAFEERIKKQLPEEAVPLLLALQEEPPVSIRLNPGKPYVPEELFPDNPLQPVPWCAPARYLKQRPVFTLDPCFHGGAYYVQEASSMFLHHLLKQVMPPQPLRALDLCAAPGGKSTLIASMLDEGSLLVSNEIIRGRASILKENVIKWGQDNIVVTNNAPADFKRLTGSFDLIAVDAPCSGEGMFRKDGEAIREWSESNLRLCSGRQQKILADIWDCLKPGGILIYSTCTYNPDENEAILEWLTKKYGAQSIPVRHCFPAITQGYSDVRCYRFYPHKTRGEGFFIGVVRKTEGRTFPPGKSKKATSIPTASLPEQTRSLISRPERYAAYLRDGTVGVVPAGQAGFIHLVEQNLRVLYKGCELAELHGQKIKLLPASALWQKLNRKACTVYEADRSTALNFLRREEIPAPRMDGDWILVTYRNLGLGWCKNIGSRLNNYYPKEWRIRMRNEEH